MLPAIIYYSNVFARVAVGLDKSPELIQDLIEESVNEEGQRESLPEKAANIVRQAFIICLNDRNTVAGGVKDGKPDGKKIGIYKMANICLRILFQANNTESCETIFHNIKNSSPPLHIYPASERVTYLYFLGLFYFISGDFYTAQLPLQAAYDQCLSDDRGKSQRRQILIYLTCANIIMGRFPSKYIYDLPEAHGFRDVFGPITEAMRKGDLETFRRIFNLDGSHPCTDFLMEHNMFYPLGNYGEALVWRSLARKVFLLTGSQGTQVQNAQGQTEVKSSSISLEALLLAFRYLDNRSKIPNAAMTAQDKGPGRRHLGHTFFDYPSVTKSTYIDPDFDGVEGLEPYNPEIDIIEVEVICGSLISQGFMKGYISQGAKKVAIAGTNKPGGALKFGFPKPWDVNRKNNTDDVPGWVQEPVKGGGQVVRLSGARAAGA